MYEARSDAPISGRHFVARLLAHFVIAMLLLLGSLALGVAGYMAFEDLSFLDAFLNAAMLLAGMGPVDPPHTDAGKWFAGAYALYAGLVFLATAAFMATPIVHRVLHRFHWDGE